MRCPNCQTENEKTATNCSRCGNALPAKPRKARRRQDPDADPDSPRAEAYNVRVRRIFNLCLWSLIPIVGVLLGPIGAVLAWRLIKQARSDPAFTALRGAQAAVLLGSISGTANLLGIVLMVIGWNW